MNKEYEIVKFTNNGVELDVSFSPEEETLWLTQSDIAKLYNVDISRVSRHITNIFNTDELDKKSNLRKTQIAYSDKPVNLYSLDVILAVGYRIDSRKGIQFRKWANKVLKEYMLKGYVINENRVTVTNENYLSLVESVNNISNEIINIKKDISLIQDKINLKELPLEKIFYNGEVFDAFLFIQNIFKKATSEIIIIDNYIDNTVLERLKCKEKNINVIIYTNPTTSKLVGPAINLFNKQYFNLTINYTTKAHDRFIIIDQNELYHLGSSIKDAGKKVFGINKMDSTLITLLLKNL